MTRTRVDLNMIKVFSRYQGDADAFARSGNREAMTDAQWNIISDFVQDLHLVREGLTSKAFAETLSRRMSEVCEDEKVIEAIKALPAC